MKTINTLLFVIFLIFGLFSLTDMKKINNQLLKNSLRNTDQPDDMEPDENDFAANNPLGLDVEHLEEFTYHLEDLLEALTQNPKALEKEFKDADKAGNGDGKLSKIEMESILTKMAKKVGRKTLPKKFMDEFWDNSYHKDGGIHYKSFIKEIILTLKRDINFYTDEIHHVDNQFEPVRKASGNKPSDH